MAKVTAPLLSFGASGTVAKTQTYSKWRGRPYVRRHVIPSNPNTVAQQSTRSVFSVANSFWKLSGAQAVAPWDLFAKGQVLTGRNAFVGRYVKNVRGETDQLLMEFSPGAKGGLIANSAVSVGVSQGLDITVVGPTPPPGWTLTGAVAAAVLNGDPATQTDFRLFSAIDLIDPYVVQLTGLEASVEYHWGAWIKWAKPDGSVAYGPSITGETTTLA